MIRTRIVVLTLCALLVFMPLTAAGERLDPPQRVTPGEGYFEVPISDWLQYRDLAAPGGERPGARGRSASGFADLAPNPDMGEELPIELLGAGSINKLAAMSSWITSDLLGDLFLTEAVWFDTEELLVVGLFTTTKDKDVVTRVKIKDADTGNVVFDESFVGAIKPGVILGLDVPVGQLPVGAYLVNIKYTQGNRKANVKYHIIVVTAP